LSAVIVNLLHVYCGTSWLGDGGTDTELSPYQQTGADLTVTLMPMKWCYVSFDEVPPETDEDEMVETRPMWITAMLLRESFYQ